MSTEIIRTKGNSRRVFEVRSSWRRAINAEIPYFSGVIPRRILIKHLFFGTLVGITSLKLLLAEISNKDPAGVPLRPGPFPS